MNQPEVQPSDDVTEGDIDSAETQFESYGIIKKTGRRMAKYSAYIFFSTILLKGIILIQSIVVARLLGPEQLGMLSIVTSLGAIVSTVSGFGMVSALVRIVPEYKLKDPQKVDSTLIAFFWLSIMTTLPVLGLYVLLDPFIAVGLYNEPDLIYLIYLWIIGALLGTFSSMFGPVLQAFQKIGLLAKLSVALGLTGAILTLSLVWLYGLPGALYASILSALAAIGVYGVVLRRQAKGLLRSLFRLDREVARRLLRVGGGVLLAGIFFVVATWYGITVLQRSATFDDVGYFKVAFGVSTMVLLIPAAISTPFYPIIVESHSRDMREGQIVLLNTAKYTMVFCFPVCLGFVFLSQVYIELLYSSAFIAAVPLVPIVAGYSFMRSYNAITNHIYLVTERMSVYSIRNGIWFAGLFLMVTLIVPAHLGVGLILAYLLMRAVVIGLDPLFFGKAYRTRRLIRQSVVCILLGFVIAAFSLLIEHLDLTQRSLLFTGALVVYAALLQFVVLDRKDKEFISGLFRSVLAGLRNR
jgi:O-antigen/teichoic acid export membrane protein